jgi:hypothetical protein
MGASASPDKEDGGFGAMSVFQRGMCLFDQLMPMRC